jgi:CheY-like chemotaxis protein
MQSEFELPEAILRAERRGQPRARFSVREQVQVTALEGMADGLGLSGILLNLSIGGLLFRVDRAVDLRRDRLMPLRADLLAPGTELAVVRILDLPRVPELQARAMVRHCDLRGEGLVMGLSFEAMGGMEAQLLDRFLAERMPEFGPAFPRKRRRGEVDQIEEEEEHPFEHLVEDREVDRELDDPALREIRDTIRSPERALLLKKRSRQILLVMQDELIRTALMGHLYTEGYRCLYEARGMVQALDLARKHNLDLLILEQHVGPHSALEILEKLRGAGRVGQARTVVLKEGEDVRLVLAAKAGAVTRVVSRPLDFAGELKPFLDQILVAEFRGS